MAKTKAATRRAQATRNRNDLTERNLPKIDRRFTLMNIALRRLVLRLDRVEAAFDELRRTTATP